MHKNTCMYTYKVHPTLIVSVPVPCTNDWRITGWPCTDGEQLCSILQSKLWNDMLLHIPTNLGKQTAAMCSLPFNFNHIHFRLGLEGWFSSKLAIHTDMTPTRQCAEVFLWQVYMFYTRTTPLMVARISVCRKVREEQTVRLRMGLCMPSA